MLILTNTEVEALLSMPALIDAVQSAHADLTLGRATQPERHPAAVPGTDALLIPMTAVLRPAGIGGVKLLADVPDHRPGAPRQQSTIVLVDAETGGCVAVLPGEAITRYRTAATSAVATRHLARPDSTSLGLIGAGAQARAHLSAISVVRPIDRVLVWSRNPRTAERFAADVARPGLRIDVVDTPRAAVAGADILCTLTPALTPIVAGAWFPAGLHVNAVGAPPRPDHREIDTLAVQRSRLVVDTRATAMSESGAIAIPLASGELSESRIDTELGDVVLGHRTGRADAAQITLFNSVGLPIQDLAAAHLVLAAARDAGIGQDIDLFARQPAMVAS